MNQSKIGVVLQTMRGPFLTLALACVFLGWSLFATLGLETNAGVLFAIVLAAVLAHVSVNMLNEYADLKSGLDLNTVRTPFSGGSGALPGAPHLASSVLLGGLAALVFVIGLGLYLIQLRGLVLLPLGMLGLLLVATYTPWINRFPGLCLVAPGLGFGFAIVLGTYLALGGVLNAKVIWASMAIFFAVNNLLLLNQLPDLDADRGAGRRHWAIAYGVDSAVLVYGVFALASAASVAVGVFWAKLPYAALIALVLLPLPIKSYLGARRFGAELSQQPVHLATNVMYATGLPLLLAISLLL